MNCLQIEMIILNDSFVILGDAEEEWSKENGFIPIIHWSAQTAIGENNLNTVL